jgi:hypothetical protein
MLATEAVMAKTNFQYEKRQRELEKKRKAEEKARRKAEAKHRPDGAGADAAGHDTDEQAEPFDAAEAETTAIRQE